LAAVVMAVATVSCGADEQVYDFTGETRDGFLLACTTQLDDSRLTTAVCQCVFDETQRRLSFDEFEAVDRQLIDDGDAPLPDEVVEVMAGCIVDEANLNAVVDPDTPAEPGTGLDDPGATGATVGQDG
jgi:hypothetical protein